MKKNIIVLGCSILMIGCAKEETFNNNIPYAQVEIDIQTQLKNEYKNPYYHEIYDKGAKNGYAGVVTISNEDASRIWAYDLCCPYEAPDKNKIQIKQSSPNATCPKCKTVYYLADGSGSVVTGVSNKRLQGYRVFIDGSYCRIRN